jgi:hypothetical protein
MINEIITAPEDLRWRSIDVPIHNLYGVLRNVARNFGIPCAFQGKIPSVLCTTTMHEKLVDRVWTIEAALGREKQRNNRQVDRVPEN